jgi:hypothetical protein
MLLLDLHKSFNMLVCFLLIWCLFSVDIPAVIDAVALITSRTLSCLGCVPSFLCTLPGVVARLIARFYLSR